MPNLGATSMFQIFDFSALSSTVGT